MSDLLPQWVAFKLGRYLNQLTWYATHTVVMPDSHHRRLTRQIWGAVERLTIELSLSDRGGGLRRQVAKLGRDWDEYLETEHYCEGWQETVRYYDTDQGHQHLAEIFCTWCPPS